MDPDEKDPHKSLELIPSGHDIQVKWHVPQPYYPTTLFCANQFVNVYAFDVDSLSYAVRFTPSDLAAYPGYQLTDIRYGATGEEYNMIANNTPTVNYTLRVWEAENNQTPTLIYEQPVPDEVANFTFGWHTLALDNPVPIDNSKNLLFGIHMQKKNILPATTPIFFALYDKTPTVAEQGNLIFFDNTWTMLDNDSCNWSLIASIVPIGPVQSYTIKRNGDNLVTSLPADQTTYLDTNVPAGTYDYNLIANYSTFSDKPIYGTISFTPAGITVVVSDDEIIRKVAVYNLQGGLVYRNNVVNATWQTVRQTLPDYPCIVQVVTQSGAVKTTKYLR
jgi:hypothetical protein